VKLSELIAVKLSTFCIPLNGDHRSSPLLNNLHQVEVMAVAP